MSIWNSFGKLATLDFRYENIASGVKPQIYANSRNQVEIIISVKVIDKNNKDEVLSLTPDDFYIGEDLNNNTEKASLYLCDTSGKKINSPWKLSKEKGDYAKAVNHDGHSRTKRDRSETTYIKTYLSCSEGNITKNFSIGIHIPGIGDFNTSTKGTTTKNSAKEKPGSGFQMPKSLEISTLNSINYSLATLSINKEFKSYDDLTKVVTDVLYTSPPKCGGTTMYNSCTSNYRDFKGESSYAYCMININTGYKLKKKLVKRNKVKLDGTKITCKTIDGKQEDSADIILGANGDNYDVSFIFVEPTQCGLMPGSTFTALGGRGGWEAADLIQYIYSIGTSDHRHYFPTNNKAIPPITDEYILVVICNHRIPKNRIFSTSHGWLRSYFPDSGLRGLSSRCKSVDIDVADEFGNEGIISISFTEGNWPKITAKGILAP